MRGRREDDERKNKGNKTNILITKELSEGLYLFFVKFVVFYKKRYKPEIDCVGKKTRVKKELGKRLGKTR